VSLKSPPVSLYFNNSVENQPILIFFVHRILKNFWFGTEFTLGLKANIVVSVSKVWSMKLWYGHGV